MEPHIGEERIMHRIFMVMTVLISAFSLHAKVLYVAPGASLRLVDVSGRSLSVAKQATFRLPASAGGVHCSSAMIRGTRWCQNGNSIANLMCYFCLFIKETCILTYKWWMC
jgi:hypothetical protein